MARKPATWLELDVLHLASTVVASETIAGGTYVVEHIDDASLGSGRGWLSTIAPSFPVYVTWDLGSAKYIDSWHIASSPNSPSESIKDMTIQWSDDNSAWTTWVTCTNLFGGSTPPQSGTIVTGTRVSHRYWRFNITSRYGVQYVGAHAVFAWDSTLIGTLLVSADLTTKAQGFGTYDQAKNFDDTYAHEGWHIVDGSGEWIVDYGSARYLGGMLPIWYNTADYTPGRIEVWYSSDGVSYKMGEVVRPTAMIMASCLHPIIFRRIYYARYFKYVFHRAMSPANVALRTGTGLMMRFFQNPTLTPATPPAPTSLVVTGDSDDPSALQLKWTQARGDDNECRDIDWEIQRSKDGGAYSTIATVASNLEARGTDDRASTEPCWSLIGSNGAASGGFAHSLEAADANSFSGGSAFTIGGWVRGIAGGVLSSFCLGDMFSKWNQANTQNEYLLSTSPMAHRLYFAASLTDISTYGELQLATGGNAASAVFRRLSFQPVHFLWVFDGSLTGNANRLKLYCDGVQQTLAFGGTIPASMTNSTSKFRLGMNRDGGTGITGSNLFRSWGIWDTALTSGNATSLYNSGTPLNFADLPSGLRDSHCIHYWNLNDKSTTTRVDSSATPVDLTPSPADTAVDFAYLPQMGDALPDTTEFGYYIDSGLADGSYTYKVRAVHHYHGGVSAYTTASTANTTPVPASAGGGAYSGFCRMMHL